MPTKYYHCRRCNVNVPAIDRHIIKDMVKEFEYPLNTRLNGFGWKISVYNSRVIGVWFEVIRKEIRKEEIYNVLPVDGYVSLNLPFHDACSVVREILKKSLSIP